MSNCNNEPPTVFCGCEHLPFDYTISIAPVKDNRTPGSLRMIDGKWWFFDSQGAMVREVLASEMVGVKW